jgi:hypothetical protein
MGQVGYCGSSPGLYSTALQPSFFTPPVIRSANNPPESYLDEVWPDLCDRTSPRSVTRFHGAHITEIPDRRAWAL